MLFNSYVFIFLFMPCVLVGFRLCCRSGRVAAASWLVLASLVFYGWWNPSSLVLLGASIAFNYGSAELIGAVRSRPRLQATCLAGAISVNLAALFAFKYLVSVVHALTGLGLIHATLPDLVLPLGISFFTFTQIGYLVDRMQGLNEDRSPLDYVLFVTFFPHLIAGPILHHQEIMPQFADRRTWRFSREDFSVGLSIFAIGLAKKCLLADPLAPVVRAGFGDAGHLPLLAAWNAALCFSLQIYFDFSGYSDMAIGLARMFNVKFPLNFDSPYKAASIIEHWQRWHMTLSRYLASYVYGPMAMAITRWRARNGLGITRAAQATSSGFATMVAFPTILTMTLAGVWHGAGLQFLVFGALHGIYLTTNHAFRILRRRRGSADAGWSVRAGNVLLTYIATVVAMVFFRAASVPDALDLLAGMIGLHGMGPVGLPAHILGGAPDAASIALACHVLWVAVLYSIVWGMPNTQQMMRLFHPAIGQVQAGRLQRLVWRPDLPSAMVIGAMGCLGVLAIGGTSEFLYFRF